MTPRDHCPVCDDRGWHTAGGNDPATCGCPAGEAYAAQPASTGVSGGTPRDEVIDLLGRVWNRLLNTQVNTPGSRAEAEQAAIQAELAIAQVTALLFIGDEIRALRDEIRWAHDQALPTPGAPEGGPLAELFRDTTDGAA